MYAGYIKTPPPFKPGFNVHVAAGREHLATYIHTRSDAAPTSLCILADRLTDSLICILISNLYLFISLAPALMPSTTRGRCKYKAKNQLFFTGYYLVACSSAGSFYYSSLRSPTARVAAYDQRGTFACVSRIFTERVTF